MNVICYDSTNRPIKELTQWDTNRKIIITGVEIESAPVIHFYNTKSDKALVVPSEFNNDSVVVSIPNLLLQSCLPLFISIYTENDNDEGKTIGTICIPIIPKKKPEDYEYTENIEYVSWVKLEEEAKVLLKELEEFSDEINNKVDNEVLLKYYTSEEVDNLYKAEDGESIIIGDKESNYAGTRGFRIVKAQRVTQDDGSYQYYYYLEGATDELLTQFQKILATYPKATNTLITYYITNNASLNKEYSDDISETYDVTKDGEYLKVRVGDVKRTWRPIPEDPNGVPADGIKDENGNYRYVWKPTDDSNIYEMDFTDTWNYTDPNGMVLTEYSYFRLSVDPSLGTAYIPCNGIVLSGSGNRVLAKDAMVGGARNTANGAHSTAFGTDNYVNFSGFVAGRKNKVLEKSGAAFGENNIVRGYGATAIGSDNEIGEHTNSTTIGNHLKTHNVTETVVGSYNIPQDQLDKDSKGVSKSVALSVGAGWNEVTRRDAMTVYKDGTTKVLGNIYSGNTNITKETNINKTDIASLKTRISANEKDITSLDTALKTANERLTNDIDTLYETTEVINDKTTLQIGTLPATGEVNKLYIVENDDNAEQYIYKIRKTPKVENVWDGVISTSKPSTLQGTGTEDDPYQITNGNELYYIIFYTKGMYSKLMNDIYLNDITKINWETGEAEEGYTPRSWGSIDSKAWKGYFDGNNYTIYGLYYNNPEDSYYDTTNKLNRNGESKQEYIEDRGCALFPRLLHNNVSFIEESSISNLRLDYCHITSHSNAGAIVAYNQWACFRISNCAIEENVCLTANLVGDIGTYGNGKATITNCYSLAKRNSLNTEVYNTTTKTYIIRNGRKTFALANHWPASASDGMSNKLVIKNCYSLNDKICTTVTVATQENCYCTESGGTAGRVINKEDMTGINALDNMPLLKTAVLEERENILKMPYDNLPTGNSIVVNSTELADDGSYVNTMSILANEDGTISVSIKGLNSYVDIDSTMTYKITTIEDYDPSICTLNYVDIGESHYGSVRFYIKDKDLYIEGISYSHMPVMDLLFIISIEKEKSINAYVNDYTHPHLASFVDGWKNVGNNSKGEITKEEFNNTIGNINTILATLVEGSSE